MISCSCGRPAELVGGDVVYPHRPDLRTRRFYRCKPCGAYVGCHKGTTRPLGTLADAKLRELRQRVHAALDSYWKDDSRGDRYTRSQAYARLAHDMKLALSECHVGMFDDTQCIRALEVIASWECEP